MKKTLVNLFFLVMLLATSSCTTYYLSVNSLAKQLPKVDGQPASLATNNLRYVIVKDKNGNDVTLPVTIHTGVRVTSKSGERKIVLFDTMLVKDSLLYANRSHILNLPIKPFHLRDIAKLEVQK